MVKSASSTRTRSSNKKEEEVAACQKAARPAESISNNPSTDRNPSWSKLKKNAASVGAVAASSDGGSRFGVNGGSVDIDADGVGS